MVATGFAYDAKVRAAQARVLARAAGEVRDIRRFGSAALDLAWTAAGRFDGYFERTVKPWDIAAGALICERAGLSVLDLPEHEDLPYGILAAPAAIAGAAAGAGRRTGVGRRDHMIRRVGVEPTRALRTEAFEASASTIPPPSQMGPKDPCEEDSGARRPGTFRSGGSGRERRRVGVAVVAGADARAAAGDPRRGRGARPRRSSPG